MTGDIFVAGISGSGKDTVANYFKSYLGMPKMRLAKTIKQIICEQNNFSTEELENQKRLKPEIRELHYSVGEYLTKQHSLNRATQLGNRTSLEFEQFVQNPDEFNIVICDVRAKDEASLLFKEDFLGIFLSRVPENEYITNHWSDNNLFRNGQLLELINEFPDNCFIIVLNNCDKYDKLFEKKLEELENYDKLIKNRNLIIISFDTRPDEKQLIDSIDSLLNETN